MLFDARRPAAGACSAWTRPTGPEACRASRRSTSRSAIRVRAGRRGVVPTGRHGTAEPRSPGPAHRRSPVAGHRTRLQKYLESLARLPLNVRPINLTTSVVTVELRSDVPSGQRRGRWSGVPLQDRQTLRRDELIAAGVGLLGGSRRARADRARGVQGRRPDRTLLLRKLHRPRRIRPRRLRPRVQHGDVRADDVRPPHATRSNGSSRSWSTIPPGAACC